MKSIIFSLLLTLISCGKIQPGSMNSNEIQTNVVIGKDNRKFSNLKAGPFKAILSLNRSCTASLVGHNLVLTAAHCLKRFLEIKDGKYVFKKIPIVYLGYEGNGKYTDKATVTNAKWGSLDFEKKNEQDWAVLKISKNWGRTIGWFNIADKEYSQDSDVYKNLILAGYSSDKKGLTHHEGCEVTSIAVAKKTLNHNCDMETGSSGGPLFKCVNKQCYILGVQSSHKKAYFVNTAIPSFRFYQAILDWK